MIIQHSADRRRDVNNFEEAPRVLEKIVMSKSAETPSDQLESMTC